MALITEFESPTQLRLLWTTELPKNCSKTSSPTFTYRDHRYSIRLLSHYDDSYDLILVNERALPVRPPRPFDARVCIRKQSDEYLSQSTTALDRREDVWRSDIFFLKEHVPGFDVKLSTNFGIVLISDSAGLRSKPGTENKMVQTLSPSQTCCPLRGLSGDHGSPTPNTEDKMVQTLSASETCSPLKEPLDDHRSPITEDKKVQTLHSPETRIPLKGLSDDLQELIDEGFQSDLELRCGHQAIPAHRLILSARSKVFRAMLQSSDAKEKSSAGSVDIQDMEFPVLRHFLGYLYAGTLPELTVELAKRLYEAADKYVVKDLGKLCAEFLGENLTMQNACELLVLADKHNDHKFKESVNAFILDQEIPKKDPEWSQFCSKNPLLGLEVLNQYMLTH